MRHLVFFFFILVCSIPSLAIARVRACLLDGGQDRTQRLCGSERWVESVRSAYRGQARRAASYTEQLISGDGNNPNPDCQYGQVYIPTGDNVTSVRATVPVNTELRPANSASQVLPATQDNANSCFNNAGAGDVCHFWSANHGFATSGGDSARFGRPASVISLMSPGVSRHRLAGGGFSQAEMSQMMNNSSCGSQRYVLNNCFSGGMHQVIYGANGRIVPNRCGVSSTNAYDVARMAVSGTSVDEVIDRDTPIRLPDGRTAYPPRLRYNYTESFSEAIRLGITSDGRRRPQSVSLDDAHFHALMNSGANELPETSSDYFLDTYFKQHDASNYKNWMDASGQLDGWESELNTCLNRVFGADYQDEPVDDLMTNVTEILQRQQGVESAGVSSLSSRDRTALTGIVARQRDQIRRYELWMCSEFWASECGRLSEDQKRDFVRRKYREEFENERNALGLAFQNLLDRDYQEPETCPAGQVKYVRRCLPSAVADHCRSEGLARLDDVAQLCVLPRLRELRSDGIFFRRYEALQNKMGQTLSFLTSANSEQVQDFLTLMKCETAPFSQARVQ